MKPVQKKSRDLLHFLLIVLTAVFLNCETGSETAGGTGGESNSDLSGNTDVSGGIQSATTWAKLYSYNSCTGGNILHAGDNNFVTLTEGGYLVKIDNNGAVKWQKSFSVCRPDAIQLTADGYILAAGLCITDSGEDTGGFALMKLDMSGSVLWAKTFSSGNRFSPCIISCDKNDNSITLAGGEYTLYYGYKFFTNQQVIKLDSTGKILWGKILGTDNYETIKDMRITPDSGYIIVENYGTVIKLDSAGEVKWTRKSGSDVLLNSVEVVSDGYLLLGELHSGDDNSDAFVMKLDSAGNSVWSKELHNVTGGGNWGEDNPDDTMLVWASRQYYDSPVSIRATPDGGYAVFGKTEKVAHTNITPIYVRVNYTGGWIVKLDAKCNISWQKKYADTFRYRYHTGDAPAAHVYYTTIDLKTFDNAANGGFVVTGGIKPESSDLNNMIIMKTDARGNITDTGLKIRNAQAVIRSADISLQAVTVTADDSPAFSVKDETVSSEDIDPGFAVADF